MTAQIIAYGRTSHKTQSIKSQLNELTKFERDNNVSFDAVYTDEGVSGSIPCLERDQFSRMFDRLRSGDTLVVWWIDRLGRDYHDAKETAQTLMKKGVVIKTINQSMVFEYNGNTQHDVMIDMMLNMLIGVAAAEKENRRASQDAGREAVKARGEWDDKFKGRRADDERNEKIAALLIEGELSIRKIAEEIGCNPSTVQRVKKTLITNNKG
ncbi:recombinase family protein [Vibrio harveyi]|uniref:recombinase family protein n=1 Tax=Vibrio harveyi TaxID=669 RepID=UPI0035EE5F2A